MGLWFRAAASYVLVTLGAVLLVEAVLIGVYAPRVITDKVNEQTVLGEVRADAAQLALKLSSQVSASDGAGLPAAVPMATPGASPAPSPTAVAQYLPHSAGGCPKGRQLSLLLDLDDTVLDSSHPDCYRGDLQAPDRPWLGAAPSGADGIGQGVGRERVAWAAVPIVQVPPGSLDGTAFGNPGDLLNIPRARRVAILYEQQSLAAPTSRVRLANVRPLLTPGLVVLGAAVPVGLFFGYATMRRPVRRLRRLAATTQALADGQLDRRIDVTGRDELSQLETDVNRMAERLAASMARERELADTRARTAERARIARDLHDSVSQDLFSLRLLADGVAQALPTDSPLQPALRQMQTTATAATSQMQAMLLHLRPAALSGDGLPTALRTLAQAYRDRVGLVVRTDLADVSLDPQREHALLRIAQEALANAVRHGEPTEATLTLTGGLLRVHDNGRGFTPGTPTHGMGLTLMAERAAEIGGVLTVDSAPAAGTTIEVRLT